jgi:uncharacterized membrane protein YagU involved in acid resistance
MADLTSETRHEVLRHVDWKAGVWAGLIAGVVFMMLEMGLVSFVQGESPWAPPRMIAAIALGQDVLPQPGTPATFNLMILTTAMVVHLVLAIVYGLIGAALASRLGYAGATALGAVCGLAIYLINFYPIASAIFPWFAMARGWISVFAHIVFGVVVGTSYVWLRRAGH